MANRRPQTAAEGWAEQRYVDSRQLPDDDSFWAQSAAPYEDASDLAAQARGQWERSEWAAWWQTQRRLIAMVDSDA